MQSTHARSRHPANCFVGFLLLGLPMLVSSLPAQSFGMRGCGGALGQNLFLGVENGPPNGFALMAMSTTRANFPLQLLSPGDPRFFGVGLDLLFAWQLDAAGSFGINVTLPANPTLAGMSLVHQAVTLPGPTYLVGDISNILPVPIGIGGAFAAEPAVLNSLRAFATTIPLPSGEVLVVGGGGGTLLYQTATNTTEIWDPVTRAVTPGPNLIAARSSHTQTLLPNGRYLLTGGVDALNVAQSSCELFDPQTRTFSSVPAMTAVRAFHTATLLANGRVLVAGGIQDLSSATLAVTSSTNTTEIYNPATNTWSPGPNLSKPRGGHTAVRLGNGKVLLCGGLSFTNFFGILSPNIQAASDLYTESTNTSATGPVMATPRAFAGSFLLPNGRALMVGGLTGNITAGGAATNLCETYNPATNSWAAAAARATAVAQPNCVQLSDGVLVALGGAGNNLLAPVPQAAVEAFDPTTATWSNLPPLATARAGAAVAPLPACGIAVFGGGTTTAATATNTLELLVR